MRVKSKDNLKVDTLSEVSLKILGFKSRKLHVKQLNLLTTCRLLRGLLDFLPKRGAAAGKRGSSALDSALPGAKRTKVL